jgi:allantoin racemase
MSIRVRVVSPITTRDPRTHELLRQLASPGLALDAVEIDAGPPSIECDDDERRAVPGTLRRIEEAAREGVDAVIIDCMGDPGLMPARELVSIPVLGPSEVSMHTAAMLGGKFSVVTVLDSVCPAVARLADGYGVRDRLASVRSIGVHVLDLEAEPERVGQLLCEQSLSAVQTDGASVIVLGCTGFLGVADTIARFLRDRTSVYVPVIDPIPLSVFTAVAWVRTGLAQSRAR